MCPVKSLVSHNLFTLGVGISLLALAGCSRPPEKNLIPVTGQIKVDGKLLQSGGTVLFIPENETQGKAKGMITIKSTYSLTTDEKPGVLPGRYNVVVEVPDGSKYTTVVEVVENAPGKLYHLELKN
jgi:hypothetical protein